MTITDDQLAALTAELARHREAVELVEGLHTEHDGRCMHCVGWCECEEFRDCSHGNEPWPCPTIRLLSNVLGTDDDNEVTE